MTVTPSDAEVIFDALESALLDVHVSLPGVVQAYDSDKQTATIALPIKRALPRDDGSYATEALPVLENVPVGFQRSKRFVSSFPLVAGDTGQVLFNEVSIDQWRSKAAETSPGDIGRHTLTGGVFYPGLVPNKEAIGDDLSADMVMGEIGGVQLRIKPGGVAEVVTAGGPTANEPVAMFDQLVVQLSLAADAAFAAAVAGDGGKAAFAAFKLYVNGLVFPLAASSNLKADNSVPGP